MLYFICRSQIIVKMIENKHGSIAIHIVNHNVRPQQEHYELKFRELGCSQYLTVFWQNIACRTPPSPPH
jgi:hypothetical protein